MTFSPAEWAVLGVVVSLAVGIIGYFLKRTMTTTDAHGKDINEIKRTYVTKDELKEIKEELRSDYKTLVADIADIKENCIRKDDFYRSVSELQTKSEKIYDLLIQDRGGTANGKK